jgi:hypothetical protein
MTATNLVRALLLATLASLASTALHAQSYNRQQLQDAYAGHLRAEQLAPEINSSGNVRFRREGRTYVIHVDERDPL